MAYRGDDRDSKGSDRAMHRRHLLHEGRATGRLLGAQGRRGVAQEELAGSADHVARSPGLFATSGVNFAVPIHTFHLRHGDLTSGLAA